ncbi:efflux RND transporter periplasmic adaptor subunit [Calothrix sp. PCC 7507]|uniref:efflux RND transporter periplasmic adaptor subunit n=1 Tax=Calothrix sp. PCC 7507 TaxID=99598 RepID=UPI00029F0BBD|nr:efflux RND transporter periplasmic adaptor subunit [Calothrix sp. PCC 7507]AFY33301.1 secretion protein HlyD family protein [Calothrix sp. PCC 7507]
MRFQISLSRGVLTTLVVGPLGLMGILSVNVLLPALKDPESRIYSSGFGYPALQRMAGKPIEVETVAVAEKNLEDSLAAPGESVAMQQVNVRSLVSGQVEEVYVKEGQRVLKKQPLLRLQPTPFENRVDTARNNLATAEKNFLALQNSIPQRLFSLKDDVKTAQVRLDAAENRLQQIYSLTEQEIKNNVEANQARLLTAEKKLKQIQLLAEQGAISQFQLYEMQDIYATRKKELLAAKQGFIDNKNLQFSNQDFYITRQKEVISAKQALEISQTSLDKDLVNARLAVENNKLALQNALRDLGKTVIYASTDGLVSSVNINSGEIVDRSSLMTITQDVVFKAYIDQARLNAVKTGDKAIVRLVAYPGQTFEGRVIQVNPTVETNAAKNSQVGTNRQFTYSVWVGVDGIQMPPGLQGYVQFVDQSKVSLVIPESSVTHLSAGEGMVMVAQDSKAVVKKVKLGRIFDNQRQVLGGLQAGEQVVPNARAFNPGDRLDNKSVQMPIAKGR